MSDTSYLPSSLLSILLSFRGAFSAPSFSNFTSLVCGWILCQGRHSVSRVIQAANTLVAPPHRKHASTLYRFLSRGRWVVDAVSRILVGLLLPFLPADVLALVDDTLAHKSGPHLFGAGMHYDASRSTYGGSMGRQVFFGFGHNWVVLAVHLPLPWNPRGIALPIMFRLYRSKKTCPAGQYRKRTDLALEMVQTLASWLPAGRRLHVVGDSEYACCTLVQGLPEGVTFTGPMPMDAAVFAPAGAYRGRGRPRRKGERIDSPKQRADTGVWTDLTLKIYGGDVHFQIQSFNGLWYRVALGQVVRVVMTRDPSGRLDDRAYFTTAPQMAVEAILERMSRRWSIEVSFRNSKQGLGLEDPQNGWWRRPHESPRPEKKTGPQPRGRRGETAVQHTFPLVMFAYALVHLWYLEHGVAAQDVKRARSEAPWYRHKREPSFEDMLAAIRREMWGTRLSATPRKGWSLRKLADLLPRWLLSA